MIVFEPGIDGYYFALDNPRVAAFAIEGTASASSTASNYNVANPTDKTTFMLWSPASVPATWTLTFNAAQTVSAVGIAAHNCGTMGVTVEVQVWNGTVYSTVATHTPTDDMPILFLLTRRTGQTQMRLRFTNAVPRIGIVHICDVTEFPRKAKYVDSLPFNEAVTSVLNMPMSDGGQVLDVYEIRRAAPVSMTVDYMPDGTRRNLLRYSEQFDNAAWTKIDATVTANAAIAPDGTTTADTVTATATDPQLIQTASSTALVYTLSCWLKGVGATVGKRPRMFMYTPGFTQFFGSPDLSPMTADWQRYSYTFTFTGAVTSVLGRFDPINTSVIAGDQVQIWGAQLEVGSTATAYQRVDATLFGQFPYEALSAYLRSSPIFMADRPFSNPNSVAFGYSPEVLQARRTIAQAEISRSVTIRLNGFVA